MNTLKPVVLSVLFWWLGGTGFLLAQNAPVIENPNSSPIQYCDDPVAVAGEISIQNIQVDEEGEGMKISISPYNRGEDRLEWDEVGNFKYNWNDGSGYLEISGIGTDTEYEEAVSKVYYRNISGSRTPGIRSFSITLRDADYLAFTPDSGHFYRYESRLDITWTQARDLAASDGMKYYGLQGYLATITSDYENDFIWTKVDGVGWIGATDEEEEGQWKWVTGPEADTLFWIGDENGAPVPGRYNKWNTGEPNNLGDEDYAHINMNPNSIAKSWNDLRNGGDGPNSEYYRAQGFIVEYGGMPGDPKVKLSAVAYVEVKASEHPELDENRVDTIFCGETTQPFEIAFTNGTPSVELWAVDSRVSIADGNTYNPIITFPEYGIYTFLLKTVDAAGCDYIDTLDIGVHNQPQADFDLDEDECYGYNLQLAYTGTTVEDAEFTWYYNSEEFSSGTGLDSITIPLGFEDKERFVGLKVNEQGCIDESLPREVNVKPDIIVSAENTEGCAPLSVKFTAATNNPAQSYLWDFADGNTSSDQGPTHQFINQEDFVQTFDISLTVLDEKNCENTARYDSMVQVYPVPAAGFIFSPDEVLITDPEVSFTNTSHEASSYLWNFGDGTATDVMDPVHRFDAMDIYSVSLAVANDFNCTDTIIKPVTVTFDRLFPPNAFSPNASLAEDQEFRIYGDGVLDEGYQLLIFNRWGEIIFESRSQNEGWDGKMKNADFAPSGVYTWVIEYTDFTGEKHKQQGLVTLLF